MASIATGGAAVLNLGAEEVVAYLEEYYIDSVQHFFLDDINYEEVTQEIASLDFMIADDEDFSLHTTLCLLDLSSECPIKAARRKQLLEVIMRVSKSPELATLKEQVSQLLHTKLTKHGVNKVQTNLPITVKAILLQRAKAWADIPRKARGHEFSFHLLRNTDTSGSFSDGIRLWSPYKAPFVAFLSILQQESNSCAKAGGYTLEDGPWMYQFSTHPSGTLGDWKDLRDTETYDSMLLDLEIRPGHLIICHSIELRLQQQRSNQIKSWEEGLDQLGHGEETFFDTACSAPFHYLRKESQAEQLDGE